MNEIIAKLKEQGNKEAFNSPEEFTAAAKSLGFSDEEIKAAAENEFAKLLFGRFLRSRNSRKQHHSRQRFLKNPPRGQTPRGELLYPKKFKFVAEGDT